MSLEQGQLDAPSLGAPRDGVGYLLRMERERRGQDLESVARGLRIRHPYLVAIEEGRYRDLPGAPYASGFVRSYAEYLGLDAAEMLRRFREESGGLAARTELVFPAPVSEGGFPAAVLIVLVIILAAAVYGIWYFYQWHRSTSAETVSTLPDRLAALIHPAGGQDQPEPSTGSAQASPVPAPASSASAAAPTTPIVTPPATTVTASPAAPQASTTAPAPNPAPSASQQNAPAAVASPPAPVPAASNAPAPPAPAQAPPTATPAQAPAEQAQAPAPQQTEVAKAEPPQSNMPANTAPPAATPAPPAGTTATVPAAPDLGPPSRVVLRANDDCWIEIRDASGAVITARLLRKGDAYPVPPRPGLSLTVGNAGALSLLLDGSPLPPLGRAGMVRHDVSLDPERLSGQAPAAANAPPAPAAAPAATPAPGNSDTPNN